MQQVVAMLDPEELLAYFPNKVIAEYADKIKAVTLSPREQYEAKNAESKCYDSI